MKKLALTCGALVVLGVALSSCSETFDNDCKQSETCPPEGDGDGDGDTGGNPGDGDGDGDTGGNSSTACDPECTPDTPICDEDAETCVECLETEDCEEGLCDTESNTCVDCLENTDCTEPSAPMCSSGICEASCAADDDCSRFEDAAACDTDAGACVECTDETDCAGKVCSPATNTCTDLEAGELFACEACVHDAQCQNGQLCVEQEFESEVVGSFCTWTKQARVGMDGFCLDDGKPFASQTAAPVISTDGASAVLCVLRSTTCPAFLQHSQSVTGCTDETPTSDAACGAPDLDDGLCKEPAGGGATRCTYPCGSNEDCSGSFTCNGAPDGYCSL